MTLRVSVAMATYRGARYLVPQLESLLRQTRSADEVVIRDDGSDDGTVELAQEFIDSHGLGDRWNVQRNEVNLGVRANFMGAARATTGDVIFFADQDDVWHPDKISHMASVFEANEGVEALSCLIRPVDQDLRPVSRSYSWVRGQRHGLHRKSLREQVTSLQCGGLTLAFRRSLFDLMDPIIERNALVHDLPFGLFAAARGGFYVLGEALVDYRIHTSNASRPMYRVRDRFTRADEHLMGRQGKLRLLEVLQREASEELSTQDALWLSNVVALQEERISRMEEPDLPWLVRDLRRSDSGEALGVRAANLLAGLGRRVRPGSGRG